MNDDLRAFFEGEGLLRYRVLGDEQGAADEELRPPLVMLGPGDEDFVTAPDPLACAFPGAPVRTMTIDEYNTFMFRWFEAAVVAGDVRCAHCGKRILAGDDLPDPDTWDAIFVEKALVAWMLVHFDCKRWLAKKLKGLSPFDVQPGAPRVYDLSQVDVGTVEMVRDAAQHE